MTSDDKQTFGTFADAADTMMPVSAVLHVSSLTLALTTTVVSQLPELTCLSFRSKVQLTTFHLMNTAPATELHQQQPATHILPDSDETHSLLYIHTTTRVSVAHVGHVHSAT